MTSTEAYILESFEESDAFTRKLKLRVPAQYLQKTVDERLLSLNGQVHLKGFRPGKVPQSVLVKRFGGAILQEEAEKALQSGCTEVIRERELRLASPLQPIGQSTESVDDCWIEAEFEILDIPALEDVSDVKIERPVVDVNEADVDQRLEQLLQYLGTWEEVDRGAQEGDLVKLNVAVAGAEATERNMVFTKDSTTLPAEIFAELVDAKVGTKFDVKATNEDDTVEQWVGSLDSVQQRQVGEWSKQTIEQMGIASGEMEDLRKETEQQLQKDAEDHIRIDLTKQVIEAFIGKHDFAIPDSAIDREYQLLKQQSSQVQDQLQDGVQDGVQDSESKSADDEQAKKASPMWERANERVKASLLVGELTEKEQLQPDTDWLIQRIDAEASRYPNPDEFKQWAFRSEEYMQQLQTQGLERAAVDFLLTKMDVNDNMVTLSSLFGLPEPESKKSKPKSDAKSSKTPTKSAKAVDKSADESADKKAAKKPAAKKATAKKAKEPKKEPATKQSSTKSSPKKEK